ncbi:hypothetical protein JW930_02855 [Candidatus Woesearchaeota archaeon]|nr:hypothetical protein [Candidatus Woesearchaeota archaeon]
MLIAYRGCPDEVNQTLLLKSFEKTPSLILDCGNAANPHNLFPIIKEEQLHRVYVVNAEAIYRFRDALKQAPTWTKELGLVILVITTIHILFSYDDELENYNVLENCWEIMGRLSKNIQVNVGIAEDSMHGRFAKKFADDILFV